MPASQRQVHPIPEKQSKEITSLVVDASTNPVQVGIPEKRGWLCLAQVEEQALEGLFLATENILRDSKKEISQVNSVYYCEGPGSTLGLRLAAAFVKTLRWCHAHASFEVFAYNALDLASLLVPKENSIIQAPFRVGFRFVRIPNSNPLEAEKKIIPQDEAFSEYPNSFHLPDIRMRATPIVPEQTISYDLSKIKGLSDLNLVSKPCSEITPYNPRAPQFKKWTPRTLNK
ncbi:MAG TPA: hypothetical protein DCF87_03685 [Opitutae bacterium]|nr:hypothetical protein [Opitutae bacterium]